MEKIQLFLNWILPICYKPNPEVAASPSSRHFTVLQRLGKGEPTAYMHTYWSGRMLKIKHSEELPMDESTDSSVTQTWIAFKMLTKTDLKLILNPLTGISPIFSLVFKGGLKKNPNWNVQETTLQFNQTACPFNEGGNVMDKTVYTRNKGFWWCQIYLQRQSLVDSHTNKLLFLT